MSTGETIGIIIFAIVAIGIRFSWHYFLFFKKSDFTICPNCKKEKPRVNKGKYKCDSCGFVFEVDKQGDAIKHSLWSIIFLFGFGISILVVLLISIFKEPTPAELILKEINPTSTFDKIFIPSIYTILVIILFYYGIKEIIGYKNNKTTHNTR